MALDKIRRVRGSRRLMLEGGGAFNGEVLHAGLVDEISQVTVPVVDGGRGATTIFDIPGDPPRKAAAALKSYQAAGRRELVSLLRYAQIEGVTCSRASRRPLSRSPGGDYLVCVGSGPQLLLLY